MHGLARRQTAFTLAEINSGGAPVFIPTGPIVYDAKGHGQRLRICPIRFVLIESRQRSRDSAGEDSQQSNAACVWAAFSLCHANVYHITVVVGRYIRNLLNERYRDLSTADW
jgi:hypothetical protein